MSFTVLEKQVMEDGINYLSSLDKNLSKFLKQFDVPVLPIEQDYFWSLTRSVIYQQISGKAAKKISDKIKLVGVTVLTSLDNKALREIGFDKDVKKLVLHQVKLANKAKLDAIVCSAQEVKLVKKFFKKEIITPGIRFTSKKNDQKRVLTPNEAYSNGADWLVIGRDLTRGNIKKNTQKLIDHLSK